MCEYLSFLCTPDLEIYYAFVLNSHADIRDVFGDIPDAAECEWTNNLPEYLTVRHESEADVIKELLIQKYQNRNNFIKEAIKSFEHDGQKFCYKDGQLHNSKGPAVIHPSGYKAYYQNGKRHRTDGPAILWSNGYKAYFQNGERHRIDGPAIVWPDGSEGYYQNGEFHRTDGPAVIWADGYKEYWQNGKLIRVEEE